MKKSKVDAVVRKFAAAARVAGERDGRADERRRWEALLPVPGHQEVTWLHEPPRTLHYQLLVMPRDRRTFFQADHETRPSFEAVRLDFEAVPMALSLASGHQIRWFHWKPRGPYPVSELAVLR